MISGLPCEIADARSGLTAVRQAGDIVFLRNAAGASMREPQAGGRISFP